MNGIIFFEDGTVQMFGQLNSVRLIAAKAQEILPQLVQQERDGVIDTMSQEELRRAVDRIAMRKQAQQSNE